MNCVAFLFALFSFIEFASVAKCGNVLFFMMPQSPSHRRSLCPFATALAEKGHKVTFLTEQTVDDGAKCTHKNIRGDIAFFTHDDPQFLDIWVHRNSTVFGDILWKMHSNQPWLWDIYWSMMIDMCRYVSNQNDHKFRQFLTQNWDLVVIDGIFAACGIATSSLIKSPRIILDPTMITAVQASHRSIPFPAATFPPQACILGHDHRNFFYRIHSAMSYIFEYFMPFRWDYLLADAVKAKFPELAHSHAITDFFKYPDFSLTELPSVMEYVRPQLRDTLSVAGHCKTGQPELTDMEWLDFITDPSSKGTILLSFGHVVQWKYAPPEVVDALFDSFARFPDYRFAFQYDGPPKLDRKNVKTSAWLPVFGILSHPKTKIHLTHGGIKSITESICTAVPMILLPIFAEQIRNADRVENLGVGFALNKFNITTEKIVRNLKTLLSDDSFKRKMEKLKFFMTEKIRPSLDVGIFWAEQLIKRKELPEKYFRIKGRKLSWIAYFNLDLIALGFVIFAVLGVAVWLLILRAMRYLCKP